MVLVASVILLISQVAYIKAIYDVHDWREEYSVVFTSRKVLTPDSCILRLKRLGYIEDTQSFQDEVKRKIKKSINIREGSRFHTYIKNNGKFSRISLLRKKRSFADNLVLVADEHREACDVQHLVKIGGLSILITKRTSIHRYFDHHFTKLIGTCKSIYLLRAYLLTQLMSRYDLVSIHQIYSHISWSLINSPLNSKRFTDDATLDKIAEGLSLYLTSLDNSGLREFGCANEFELIYEDEIRGPCEKMCNLTEMLYQYREASVNYLKEYWSYYDTYVSEQELIQWDKFRLCCKIIDLPRSFIGRVGSKVALRECF